MIVMNQIDILCSVSLLIDNCFYFSPSQGYIYVLGTTFTNYLCTLSFWTSVSDRLHIGTDYLIIPYLCYEVIWKLCQRNWLFKGLCLIHITEYVSSESEFPMEKFKVILLYIQKCEGKYLMMCKGLARAVLSLGKLELQKQGPTSLFLPMPGGTGNLY